MSLNKFNYKNILIIDDKFHIMSYYLIYINEEH